MKLEGSWQNINVSSGYSYTCGYCGAYTAPSMHYFCTPGYGEARTGAVYICASCNQPTFVNYLTNQQTPGELCGKKVDHLPTLEVTSLYEEARKCISVGAYTSSVLACRKLLMNIAVSEGADEGLNFVQYVDYLENSQHIPSKIRGWVDEIRRQGNIATHEITVITEEEAKKILSFTEMLLRIMYEYPAQL
ncbi:DUF4145 domain-containing protein [Bacillus wiedmannii]|uniref:DUF4145 domain-containing protein n=1 Tax=Bacillus wiedmannii TaxID=1890302 RepID=UPI001482FD7E|nr:DUF4145 domain-containing protein [Bacillus wiedmannii]